MEAHEILYQRSFMGVTTSSGGLFNDLSVYIVVPIAGDGDLRTLTLILVPPQIPLPRSRPPHPLSPSPSNRPPSPASPWPSFTATAPLLPPHTLPSPPHPHNPSPSPFPHPHGPAEEDHSHLQLHPLVSISRPHQLSLLQIHKPLPQPQLLHLGRRQLLLRGDLTPVVITTRTPGHIPIPVPGPISSLCSVSIPALVNTLTRHLFPTHPPHRHILTVIPSGTTARTLVLAPHALVTPRTVLVTAVVPLVAQILVLPVEHLLKYQVAAVQTAAVVVEDIVSCPRVWVATSWRPISRCTPTGSPLLVIHSSPLTFVSSAAQSVVVQ